MKTSRKLLYTAALFIIIFSLCACNKKTDGKSISLNQLKTAEEAFHEQTVTVTDFTAEFE